MRLDKARRSYRSIAVSPVAFASTTAANFSSPPGGFPQLGAVEQTCNQATAMAAHAIKIDLGLCDPPRVLQHLFVRVRATNPIRDCLGERRERGIRRDRDVQAVTQRIL
ncbi:MAG: hypothetical protein WBQ45_00385, partial [Roseiarcus sp.]